MINHMTNDEWRSKSDDWHKGWRYAQGDDYVIPKNTPDFIEGYKYACNHLEGPCYSINATTGNKEYSDD